MAKKIMTISVPPRSGKTELINEFRKKVEKILKNRKLLKDEMTPIRVWAGERGIYKNGNITAQTVKLLEEAGELAKAVLEGDKVEIKDAIGDCAVVLVSVAHFAGLTFEDCVNSAYSVISKRKGKMQNGTFVRNKTKKK